ncbi:MAG: histidine phosphatase family protein [Planctomycetes bacterium]|jgi:phosphohistidine phosphatase|nr:histidine phosphatase family protein [Planctomycetota bacterium]
MGKRELLVLRHAKAEAAGGSDETRDLTKRGIADCDRIAAWLEAQDLVPDEFLSSTAVRAARTAKRVMKGLRLKTTDLRTDERLYLASMPRILDVLGEISGQRVLLVAHNPGLGELVEHLSGGTPEPPGGEKAFPTAALAWFRLPGDWARLRRGDGELVALIRPKALP